MSTDYSLLHVYTQRGGPKGDSITFRFYQDPPNISGGGGGFQAVQRLQNAAIVAWRGPSDAYTMELNLIMDAYASLPPKGRARGWQAPDIEADCRTLDKFSGTFVHPVTQPPLLVLDANGALQNDYYHMPSALWVIPEQPTFSDVLRNSKGMRTRQVVTVKFMHYLGYDELTRNKNISAQNDHSHQFETTPKVNTFKKAAAHYAPMRNAKWGMRLAQLNGKRDPTAKLMPGRWYKLPTQAQFNDWQKTSRR